ncbi:uncharacterized protein LOC107274754 isoform X2 [Cephus cinctus]|uniref:Uncharacterized protein LOC107274754 isoform X2 n=1 Tax=Cephus cinctus TaxID=211228 RepID=A0AAJ7RV22_CEPCN|nr:uncharacterized protein LOC107274754 isoform X2 [Cephus cinctus]
MAIEVQSVTQSTDVCHTQAHVTPKTRRRQAGCSRRGRARMFIGVRRTGNRETYQRTGSSWTDMAKKTPMDTHRWNAGIQESIGVKS